MIFAALTAQPDVSRRLAEQFARLPEDRPVLILRPPRALATSLTGYMVAYQALPRRVLIREARFGDSAAAVATLREEFSAVVFIEQEPPAAFPAGVSFGGAFDFVPLVP